MYKITHIIENGNPSMNNPCVKLNEEDSQTLCDIANKCNYTEISEHLRPDVRGIEGIAQKLYGKCGIKKLRRYKQRQRFQLIDWAIMHRVIEKRNGVYVIINSRIPDNPQQLCLDF